MPKITSDDTIREMSSLIETEPGQLVRRIVLGPELFPEGSVGQAMLPEALVGRDRPAGILRPNISQLLYTPLEQFKELGKSEQSYATHRLKKFFKDVSIGPEGNLVSKVFGNVQDPVSLAAEAKMRQVVSESIDSMNNPNSREILNKRYGIEDGAGMTVKQTAFKMDVTQQRVRSLESKALKGLRHPNISRRLGYFVSYTEASLARLAWGSTCRYDVLALFGDPDQIDRKDHLGRDSLIRETPLGSTKVEDLTLREETIFYLNRELSVAELLIDWTWDARRFPGQTAEDVTQALRSLAPKP